MLFRSSSKSTDRVIKHPEGQDDGSDDDDATDSRSESGLSDSSDEDNDGENSPQNEALLDEKPRFGRRRRRATSSGVVGS